MRRLALVLIVAFTVFSLGFSFWRKSTIIERPRLADMESYVYVDDTGFSHLFDCETQDLDGLLEKADAVAIVQRSSVEQWQESCLLLEVEVLRCFKGNLGERIPFYEPIGAEPRGEIHGVLGYVPMQEGKEYLVFLQKVKSPYDDGTTGYYPLCADIGKYEKGNKATLLKEDLKYGEVKDMPLALKDMSYMFYEGRQRVELYNRLYEEIEKRGMFER